MTMTKKEILAKLNSIAKPADDWLVDAKFRVDNQEWLKKSQAIALKILRKLRDNKANQIIPSTQVQLAEQLGVSAQQVNKWVKGKENFTIDTISKLEAALSIGLFDIPKPQTEIIIHKSVIESLIYSRRSKTEFKKKTEIGLIGNYYGYLNVMTLDGKFYWCIENYDTDFEDLEDWEEINEELYNSIIKFYNSKKQ